MWPSLTPSAYFFFYIVGSCDATTAHTYGYNDGVSCCKHYHDQNDPDPKVKPNLQWNNTMSDCADGNICPTFVEDGNLCPTKEPGELTVLASRGNLSYLIIIIILPKRTELRLE